LRRETSGHALKINEEGGALGNLNKSSFTANFPADREQPFDADTLLKIRVNPPGSCHPWGSQTLAVNPVAFRHRP
jgi:hypothetical protein